MKNSHAFILVLASVASTIAVMKYLESVETSQLNVQENLNADGTLQSSNLVIANPKNTKEKARITEPEDKAVSSGTAHILEDVYIVGDSKALNSRFANEQIQTEHFDDVIYQLTSEQTQTESDREYELGLAINDDTHWAAYEQHYGCGKGVCAVELRSIPKDQIDEVISQITSVTKLKATIQNTLIDSNGTYTLRLIGGSSPETTSIAFELTSLNFESSE